VKAEKTVLINGVEAQCSGVNRIDDLGAAHALSKSVCFGFLAGPPPRGRVGAGAIFFLDILRSDAKIQYAAENWHSLFSAAKQNLGGTHENS